MRAPTSHTTYKEGRGGLGGASCMRRASVCDGESRNGRRAYAGWEGSRSLGTAAASSGCSRVRVASSRMLPARALVNSSCPQHAVPPSCQMSGQENQPPRRSLLLILRSAYCDLPVCSARSPPPPSPLTAWGNPRPLRQGSWHKWNRTDQDGRSDGEGEGGHSGSGSSFGCPS